MRAEQSPGGLVTRSRRSPARSPERVCGGLAGATTAIVARAGSAGGLIRAVAIHYPRPAPTAPRETLSIASSISSRVAAASRTRARRGAPRPVRGERAARVEPQRHASALQEDRVGRHVRVRRAQGPVADPVPDHLAEPRLVGVPLGDQRPARALGQRPDLAVGDEGLAPVDAVEDDVLAHRGRESHRRPAVQAPPPPRPCRSGAP